MTKRTGSLACIPHISVLKVLRSDHTQERAFYSFCFIVSLPFLRQSSDERIPDLGPLYSQRIFLTFSSIRVISAHHGVDNKGKVL